MGRSKATERPVVPCDKQVVVTAVAVLGRTEPRVLTHGPETAAVHFTVDASGKGKFAWITRFSAHDREILRARRKEEMP